MGRLEPTEITVREDGTEQHESWVLVGVNRVTGQGRLFDSEVTHDSYMELTIKRCTRKRQLHSDYMHATDHLVTVAMSEVQWAAVISNPNNGDGQPATLQRLDNQGVPGAPFESRLKLTHDEVRRATERGAEQIDAAVQGVLDAFERKAGRKEMQAALNTLRFANQNLPGNMQFTAKAFTEHVEAVVTKATHDIESKAMRAAGRMPQLAAGPLTGDMLELGAGDIVVDEITSD